MGWYNVIDGYKTTNDVAKYFSVDQNTVLEWIHSGVLEAEVHEGELPKYWISIDALDKFKKTYREAGGTKANLSKKGYTSVVDVAKMYEVRPCSVHYWIDRGYLDAVKTKKGTRTVYMITDESLNRFDDIYTKAPKDKNNNVIKSILAQAFAKEEDKVMADIPTQETGSLEQFVAKVNAAVDNWMHLAKTYETEKARMLDDIIQMAKSYGYEDFDDSGDFMVHARAMIFRAPSISNLRHAVDDEFDALKKLFEEAGFDKRMLWGVQGDE